MINRPTFPLIAWLTPEQPTAKAIDRLNKRLTHRWTEWPQNKGLNNATKKEQIHRTTNSRFKQLTDLTNNELNDWLAESNIEQPNDQSTNWLTDFRRDCPF